VEAFPQDQFVIWPPQSALLPIFGGANAGASRHNQTCGKRRLTEEIASLRVESGGLFALVAPYLQWCLTGVKFTELEAASLEMRGLLPLRQKR
jgi:hypothetical protein